MKNKMKNHPDLAGLKRLRLDRGLSQQKLAESLDVDPKCISRYESEALISRAPMLKRICEILDCALWELFYDPEIHRRAA